MAIKRNKCTKFRLPYQGFTLIELLAVIVILAIIALIATPIVLNIIEDVKESTNLRSGEFYLDAVEQAIMRKKLKGEPFKLDSCNIGSNGNLWCDAKTIEVEVSGKKPVGGKILFENGVIKNVQMIIDGKVIIKNSDGQLDYNDKLILENAKKYFDLVKNNLENLPLEFDLADGIYKIMENGNICGGYLLEGVCEDEVMFMDIESAKPTSGFIQIENKNIKKVRFEFDNVFVAGNAKGELKIFEYQPSCQVIKGDGSNVGDEISCAGEEFYVISNDGTTILMLAKYNLYVGNEIKEGSTVPLLNPTGLQSERATGLKFDTNELVSNAPYESLEDLLNEIGRQQSDSIGVVTRTNFLEPIWYYDTYLIEHGINSALVSLPNSDQLENLGCDKDKLTCGPGVFGEGQLDKMAPSWVYSSSYFAAEWKENKLYSVFGSGLYLSESLVNGIRPLVYISIYEI